MIKVSYLRYAMIRYSLFFLLVMFSANVWGQDTIAPSINLLGQGTVALCQGMPYTDAGYTVSDNIDSAQQLKIEMEGDFPVSKTEKPGIFSLRYKATDRAGNTGYSGWRLIRVQEAGMSPCEETPKDTTKPGDSGISDLTIDADVRIYPNPARGEMIIKMQSAAFVAFQLVDITGKMIPGSISKTSSSTWHLSFPGNPPGLYLLYIQTEHGTSARKIYLK